MTMQQLSLLDAAPARFDGDTFNQERDGERLTSQWWAVFNLMKDSKWRTLSDIEAWTSAPQSSIGARLRDCRKERFGEHTVNNRYLGSGLHEYQLIPNPEWDGVIRPHRASSPAAETARKQGNA
jgi:hypothetical protein